jgi:hypothetical protein
MKPYVAAVETEDAGDLVQAPAVAGEAPAVAGAPVSALARTRAVIGDGRNSNSERRQS